tara:strand:- start:17944 stop:18783 length:840 start_codon:yes stop_codon:yes gene_type:complete
MNVLESTIGNLLDSSIYELYWNNSLFISNVFQEIVDEIANSGTCVDLIHLKRQLFKEILRNLLCLSHSSKYNGNLTSIYVFPLYVCYNLYTQQIEFGGPDFIFHPQSQLAFLNSLVGKTDFPSKFDNRHELLEFAQECANLSDFLKRKNCGTLNNTNFFNDLFGGGLLNNPPPCDLLNNDNDNTGTCGGNSDEGSTSICPKNLVNPNSVPTSIDKILETINKLLESENMELSGEDKKILDHIDQHIENSEQKKNETKQDDSSPFVTKETEKNKKSKYLA